jgi:radical SAM superfamily enzyme YgiQ (UPF0313 family)
MRADQGHRLPDETLELARRAGLRRVMVGVEAGTDEMLKRIRKDITIAQVYSTAEKLVRNKIGAIWNFIVGFPDEPEESFEATLQIAKRLRAMSQDFEAAIFFYKPYPGNELAEQLRSTKYQFPLHSGAVGRLRLCWLRRPLGERREIQARRAIQVLPEVRLWPPSARADATSASAIALANRPRLLPLPG